MIQKMFGVRDGKALAFLQPFFSISAGAAIRAFGDAVNESNSVFGKHPEDYVLYELGTFDDNSGEFIGCGLTKMLGTASEFVVAKSNFDPSFIPKKLEFKDGQFEKVMSNGKE